MTDLPTTMMDIPVGQEWIIEMINNILIEVLASIAEQLCPQNKNAQDYKTSA